MGRKWYKIDFEEGGNKTIFPRCNKPQPKISLKMLKEICQALANLMR